jgi:predicted ATPase
VTQVSKRLGPKVFEIRVAPTTRRQRVTIADAGFGLSQALPLVAYDARLSRGFPIAYQPEVHLHPFAQSRLADILVESVERRNQVFVETHSPDLVLRLQLKVARGEMAPGDLRVFCLESKRGRSSLKAIDFDDKGAPAIPWPAGFLDTSLLVARDLAAERTKRKHVP